MKKSLAIVQKAVRAASDYLAGHPVAERALKTFVQAFAATLIVTGGFTRSTFTAAFAAGISAAWNYLKTT